LGNLVIREVPYRGRHERSWSSWRSEAKGSTRIMGIGEKLHQYYGKAVMYENILVLKPWHGCHENDELFKDMDAVDAYINSLPAWDKTEYCCLQLTDRDPGKVRRCDNGQEVIR